MWCSASYVGIRVISFRSLPLQGGTLLARCSYFHIKMYNIYIQHLICIRRYRQGIVKREHGVIYMNDN